MIICLYGTEDLNLEYIASELIKRHFIEYKISSFKHLAKDVYSSAWGRKCDIDFESEHAITCIKNIRETTPKSLPENWINLFLDFEKDDVFIIDGKYSEEFEVLNKKKMINMLVIGSGVLADENLKSAFEQNENTKKLIFNYSDNLIDEIIEQFR